MESPQNSVVRLLEMDRVWFPAGAARATTQRASGRAGTGPRAERRAAEVGQHRAHEVRRSTRRGHCAVTGRRYVRLCRTRCPVSPIGTTTAPGLSSTRSAGYVVVDRNTVPIAIGDVTITFAGSLEVNGKIEQLHPLHNLAMVSYDPQSIGDTPVSKPNSIRAAAVRRRRLGCRHQRRPSARASAQHGVVGRSVGLPLSRTLRFRDSNIEGIDLVNAPMDVDGVLVDKRAVFATWSSFAMQSGGESRSSIAALAADLVCSLSISCEKAGLSTRWKPSSSTRHCSRRARWVSTKNGSQDSRENNPVRRRALSITRTGCRHAGAGSCKNGDYVLAIDGNVVTSYRELEKAVQKPE